MTDYILDRLVAAVGTQYVVDAEIGRGGMAVVYGATDARLHRRVAIKVLPPELAFNADVRERFLREAQTSAQLAHPSIVPIYTVDEREGLVYFVMALVEGESLAQRLVKEPRLPLPQVRAILMHVADALSYAHARGVVHRDVKPDNIMLDATTGRAMVTDFGIARAAAGDSRLTLTGVAIGTPAYMSPEQALGERELDGRSDIYSLAVIAYQMVAGETPFKASNTPAMLVKHVSEAPRPLGSIRPDVPAGLAHAIARALAKKPEERWADAAAFRDALSGAIDVMPFHEPAPRQPHFQPAPPATFPVSAPAGWTPAPPPEQHSGTGMPPMPAMPTWGSKADWQQWRQEQKAWEREQKRRQRAVRRSGDGADEAMAARPLDERITSFQRKSIGAIATIGSLAIVNIATVPEFLWFLIPGAFISMGVLSNAGKLWADGVALPRLFKRRDLAALPPSAASRAPLALRDPHTLALQLASADVLAGPHGESVRRAAVDRANARDILARLAPSERELISDVGPTVDALAERVGSLALTLHRLDADVAGTSVPALEQRLSALRAEAGADPTAEQARRLSLLDRQRGSIAELSERRGTLAAQLESAVLALQNLRLDLLKLRSSGLGGAMGDGSSATQEARALSREIGHAVDAVREANRL